MADTLDKLEAVARAATPGPWDWTWDGSGQPGRIGKTLSAGGPAEDFGYDSYCVALTHDGKNFNVRANAEHIAAFNPKTALALLAVARAASSMIREYDDLMLLLPGEHPAGLRAALEELEGKK